MAEKEMRVIAAEAAQQFQVEHVLVVHRTGVLGVGEASILIVTAHPHRANAIAATRYIIEEVKRRAPIWKRELYTDGTREWVDPTPSRAGAAP
jgi:molybdopterin synthase catalytic subunit